MFSFSQERGVSNRDNFIGTCTAAKELGVSVRTIQLWSEKGILDAWKTSGGHRRITRESVARVQRAWKAPHAEKGLRILIVEDDLTMQTYYEALLAIVAPKADVVIAPNGFEGLIAFGKHSSNFVIADIDMPIMNGFEMINAILNGPGIAPSNIIAVTGLSLEELTARGELAHGVRLLPKPLDVSQLKRAIGEAFEAKEATE